MADHMNMPAPKTKGGRRALIATIALLAAALLAYVGGVVYFHLFFMPGTTLDGADVSLRRASEVAEEKADAFAGYQAHVTGDGVDLTISADQIGLRQRGNRRHQPLDLAVRALPGVAHRERHERGRL